MNKPFSQACENNKRPILEILQRHMKNFTRVLEIGSGSGQHAVFFAEMLPRLVWQCSDLLENHAGIKQWTDDCRLANVRDPINLDVTMLEWPTIESDAVFSANTAHIMSWPVAQLMISGAGKLLPVGGLFCLYGPFNYHGTFTSDSNARFDLWLKERDPEMGIRDFEAVCDVASQQDLRCIEDNAMPANNRLLVFEKTGPIVDVC